MSPLPQPTGQDVPTLIVVDDDRALRESIVFSFETEGFDVRSYADAEALLEESRAAPARGCMVVDFNLPGVDGLTLLATLRQRGLDLPALLITTPNRKVLAAAAAAGVPVVEKPLLARSLIEEVDRQLPSHPIPA